MRDQKSFNSHSDRKELVVTALALEMRRIVQHAASPVQPGETIKAQQRRAWEALKRPPFWRLRAAWYGEAGSWSAVAADDLRRRDAERRRKEAKARDQASELAALYQGIAARLSSTDADFHRHDVAALLDAARSLGAGNSAVAEATDKD